MAVRQCIQPCKSLLWLGSVIIFGFDELILSKPHWMKIGVRIEENNHGCVDLLTERINVLFDELCLLNDKGNMFYRF